MDQMDFLLGTGPAGVQYVVCVVLTVNFEFIQIKYLSFFPTLKFKGNSPS